MKRSNLNKCLYNFKYFFIKDDQFNINLAQKSDIAIIDMHEELQHKYFIVCFKDNLLIIPESNLIKISKIFNSTKTTFYFIQTGIKPLFIDQLSKSEDFSIKNFNSFNSDDKFESEIESFSKVLIINDQKVAKFWKIIRQSISGYFIKKSYNNTKNDRIKNYKEILMSKPKENLIESNEFIHLRHSGDSDTSHVELLYHIEREELFVEKIIFDSEEPKLFQREFSNYLNCHHPFLARYFGTIKIGQAEHLAIEYIQGKTLSYINDINLDFYEFLRIVFEILVAIQYIHQNGYIYRDLKPNNLIIDQNNNCVLIDFDRMIKNEPENTGPNSTKTFTSNYVAPELFEEDEFNEKVDVYSVGKIINFIFFENRQKIEKNTKFALLQDDFNHLKCICNQCLQNNPNNRPSISQLMIKIFDYIYLRFFILFSSVNYINFDKFLEYWGIIVENSFPQKMNNIGVFYNISQKVPRNVQKGFNYLIKAATERNDSDAQRNLANYYLLGDIVPRNINKSIQYFHLAADNNDVEAQYSLGMIYYKGELVGRNVEKALYYLTKAANQNHKEAQFYLGYCYKVGNYIPIDINMGIYYMKLSADNNFPEAQYILGNLYLNGSFVEKNIEKAIYYLTLAANQQNRDAQKMLFNIYNDRKYGQNNPVKAMENLILQSENNDSKAYFKLGYMYYYGKIVKQNFQIAFDYYIKAAKLYNLDAINFLGLIYYEGIYLPKNINKALKYWTYSANNGCGISQFNLGMLYYNGIYIKQDIPKSIHYLTLSSNNGFTKSGIYLGKLYFEGIYVEKNIRKAYYYFRLAEKDEKDNSFLLNILGRLYFEGLYVPKDVNKGISYIKKAADSNDPDGLYNLGYIYYEGKNYPRNIQKAIYFLELAADQNNCSANYLLGFIYYYGIDVPKDIKKAFHYFQRSVINSNDPIPFWQIASFYIKGICTPQNIEKGMNYLIFSANQGFSNAQYDLGWIYYEGVYVPRNINKAIFYYNESATNNSNIDPNEINSIIKSNFLLGVIYQQGLFILRDIQKAISYYKQASSYNHKKAKNNLAIIFKNGLNCNKNIAYAIELLNEAIHQKNDPVAMYNLAHIYFFDYNVDTNFNECINLLKNSFLLKFEPAKDFLCLVLVTKYDKITIQTIQNEMVNNNDLVITIFNYIKDEMLENDEIRMNLNQKIKNLDYSYDFYNPIPTKDFMYNEKYQNINTMAKNITDQFYEGFGLI